ncbi:MAG: hypothetical protein A2857_06820 [Candidatus Levybacteria bacterium RIFCSPHIGHO2_01_FULL_36_15]|nr:MAG: hypothetical protein A2857_06820 [Candidatus Levybacteria bacterium RIFCSPHIGHO2_01_FULL_36_15]OGH37806.1 MAG: hypothetical protein A2905_00145 [Candidatus Levybacteria bacterium RIFCSPLOWO2_01_FULL_36_10]
MRNIIEDLNKIFLKLLEPMNQNQIYETIVSESIKLVKAEYGSILLAQDGTLKRVYTNSPEYYQIKARRKGFAYKAYKTHRPFVLGVKHIKNMNPKIRQMGIKSIIAIPLSYRNSSVGVLTFQSSRIQHFTSKDLNLLKLLGSFVSQRIRNINLLDETKKALETRNQFISMAAHEFRTPLTSINGYVQLLQNKFNSNSVPRESKWVNELAFETSRLTSLVNDLLEINKIQSGSLNFVFKICSLTKIVNAATESLRFKFPGRKILFKSTLKQNKDLVIGDYDRLVQVIVNLLDNALKFSEKEVLINLKNKSSYLTLTIKDQGAGIPKKDLPKIFEGFYKGHSGLREGMGLGLYIAKNIVTSHHGSLEIYSAVDKGTTVKLKLRRAKPTA